MYIIQISRLSTLAVEAVKMSENYAAVLYGPYDVRIEKRPIPIINNNEVLIKIECVGICGSDIKLYSQGKCGVEEILKPLVIGHEGAGTVVQVGSNVTSLKPGDRVAVEPTQPCRACEFCKQGRYNLCLQPRYCSTIASDGNLCKYYKHVADFCYKLPDTMSMEEGAAVQPLAIAMHACNRANIKVGTKMAIFGAGPIGLLCAMTAKAMGATDIVLTDVLDARLMAMSNFGFNKTLNTRHLSEAQAVDKVTQLLGDRPTVTIDACGFPAATRAAMEATKAGGTVLVVGISEGLVEVPLSETLLREVDIKGSLRIMNTYPAAIAAVSSGIVDLKSFITQHYYLEDTKKALEHAKTGDAMKIIIHIPK